MLGPGMEGITDVEGRTQFSLWCILAAPLMLGTDVRAASAYTLATIGNAEAIAINQDALGVQGMILAPGAEPSPYDGGYLINLAPCPPPEPVFNWTLTADGHLQAAGTDQCATVFECATGAGSPVGAYGCTTNACGNQLWAFSEASGQVTTLASGAARQCLTGAPGAAGPQLAIQPCAAGNPLQAWSLSAGGQLSIASGGGGGAPLCAWLPDVSDAQVNVYYKPLAPANGAQPIALAVLNRGAAGVPGQNVSLADLGFAEAQRVVVRDVWAATTSAPVAGSFVTRAIDSHETLLLRVTPVA
jgi:alpha-galactosidase